MFSSAERRLNFGMVRNTPNTVVDLVTHLAPELETPHAEVRSNANIVTIDLFGLDGTDQKEETDDRNDKKLHGYLT